MLERLARGRPRSAVFAGMPGRAISLAQLEQPSRSQGDALVGEVCGLLLAVARHDDGGAIGHEFMDAIEHDPRGRDVKRGRRLIEKEELRPRARARASATR